MKKLARIFSKYEPKRDASAVHIYRKHYPFNMEDVEKYILSLGKLHFFLEEKELEYLYGLTNIEDILLVLLKHSRKHESFSDNNVQTCLCRFTRSIIDIYRLVIFYFPETKLRHVYQALISLLEKKRCYSWICADIDRRVYGVQDYGEQKDIVFNGKEIDEVGYNFTKYSLPESANHYPYYSGNIIKIPRQSTIINPINIYV